MSKSVIFMIESGRALELVKQHIAEKTRVREEVFALAKEIGVERICTSRVNGVLRGVEFNGEVYPQFTKPKKGISYPKKGTEWAKRFAAQKGYKDPSTVISEAFEIPLGIHYGKAGAGTGWRMIGNPLNECGFLYLGPDGPYAMWVPNVHAEVAKDEANGYAVAEPAKSFNLEFEGCRRIEDEEWDILVAQHKLDEKKARAAEQAQS